MKTILSPIRTSIPLVLLVAANVQAAEVWIESIHHGANGLTLIWTNSEPGYAYTLQHRTSPAVGIWSNVWTRYRWPVAMTSWTEPTRLLSGAGFYRVVAQPIQAPQRGQVLASPLLRQFSLGDVLYWLNRDGVPDDDAQWPVNSYKIVYETVDPFGLPITASGGLFVPQGVAGAMPLLSDQHGTEIYKPWVPSQDDTFWYSEALLFASSGYVTLMPDYLGLGASPGLHPWLHAKTEASAVVDMLRAVKTFCADQSIPLNSQLFLTGYSQGGHATAAAHREIEMYYTNEFTVTASAPMAGPYDILGTAHHILTNTNYPGPEGFILVLAAWLPIYDFADSLEELLASPYDETLPPLFDGYHTISGDIIPAMAPDAQSVLDPAFLNELLTATNHPFWLASADNDLLDWAPQAPMRLYHCSGDEPVPYTNSVLAYQSYTNNGACCVELVDPTPLGEIWDHYQCFWPSLIGAKAWFDTMKQ